MKSVFSPFSQAPFNFVDYEKVCILQGWASVLCRSWTDRSFLNEKWTIRSFLNDLFFFERSVLFQRTIRSFSKNGPFFFERFVLFKRTGRSFLNGPFFLKNESFIYERIVHLWTIRSFLRTDRSFMNDSFFFKERAVLLWTWKRTDRSLRLICFWFSSKNGVFSSKNAIFWKWRFFDERITLFWTKNERIVLFRTDRSFMNDPFFFKNESFIYERSILF